MLLSSFAIRSRSSAFSAFSAALCVGADRRDVSFVLCAGSRSFLQLAAQLRIFVNQRGAFRAKGREIHVARTNNDATQGVSGRHRC